MKFCKLIAHGIRFVPFTVNQNGSPDQTDSDKEKHLLKSVEKVYTVQCNLKICIAIEILTQTEC